VINTEVDVLRFILHGEIDSDIDKRGGFGADVPEQ
jgi:hypothetical protein